MTFQFENASLEHVDNINKWNNPRLPIKLDITVIFSISLVKSHVLSLVLEESNI